MAKKRMPFKYGIIGIFKDFLTQISIFFNETKFSTINIHICCLFRLTMSLNVDFMAKKTKKCTKSDISQFETLNFDFGAFLAQLKRSFQENFAKNSPKWKFNNQRR